jgi:DNA-binding Lrp family transcriptional regulator
MDTIRQKKQDSHINALLAWINYEGIIRRFTLSLNNDLLGYDHLAFAGINIRPGFADRITEELLNL